MMPKVRERRPRPHRPDATVGLAGMPDVLIWPHQMLTQPCEPVTKFDGELQSFAQHLCEVRRRLRGVGLAANQCGLSARLFVYLAEEDLAVVNPVIAERSEEMIYRVEGCLSMPGAFLQVPRHERVVVRGQDFDGDPIEIEAEGLQATILQHEVDHLDGKTILDRVTRQMARAAERSIEKQCRRVA